MKNIFNKLDLFTEKITHFKLFNEIYILIIALVALLGWQYSQLIGMITLIILATLVLVITRDLTFIIPNTIFLIFSMNQGFSNSELPIPLVITVACFVVILLTFTIINGFHLKKMKSLWGLLALAILNIIPIFWNQNNPGAIQPENFVFYFLYFANLGYLLVYILFVNGIKRANLRFLAITFSYLGIILSFECGLKILHNINPELNANIFNVWFLVLKEFINNPATIFNQWYWLGWGLCNEAGIMICVSLPFTFYLMADTRKFWHVFPQGLKIIIMALGILVTTSRGSYVIAAVITGLSLIALFFISNNKKGYAITFVSVLAVCGIVFLIFRETLTPWINNMIETVFPNGLDDNGREELWIKAYDLWKSKPLYWLFGSGIVSEIEIKNSSINAPQLVPVIYHSTLFETLALGGGLALIALGYHLFQKYKFISKTNKAFFVTMLIGFFCVDIYGLLDNTYYMYYYMIPLMIIISMLDLNYIDKTKYKTLLEN